MKEMQIPRNLYVINLFVLLIIILQFSSNFLNINQN